MEFLVFVIEIVMVFFIFNLFSRITKLEQLIKSGLAQNKADQTYQLPLQQFEKQQPAVQESLFAYIKQQLERGADKEEIRKILLNNGWQPSDIEEAFNTIIVQSQTERSFTVVSKKEELMLFERFVDWLKEDWLLKLGALLLIIGFGWLTSYAFLNNWIGPMGRIAFGLVAGTLFLILGSWRIKNYLTQGGVFLIVGSTTILLTIFAARTFYDFFTPFSALVVMFLSTVFVAFSSVKYNSRALSLSSLILASIAPLLTNSSVVDHVGLFAYLFIVVLGAIWIVALTGQRELTLASLFIVSMYSLPYLFSSSSFSLTELQILLLFAYAFVALFFLTNIVGIIKLKKRETVADFITAFGNGFFLLAWIMTVAQDEWKSLIIAFWMIVFAVGAFLIFKITQRQEPFYFYAGLGIAMLAAATSAELHGPALTIAYTIEAGIITLVAYLILQDIKITKAVSLLLIVPAILAFGSFTSYNWGKGVIHNDFFVLLILALTFLGLGTFFLRYVKEDEKEETDKLSAILLIVGSFYAYMLLWLSLHAGLQNKNTAVTISLIIYTIIGLLSYFYGLAKEKNRLRLYGGSLVGFVVIRLILVDVWTMEIGGRIITFFLIGALLMSTAFFGRKKNELINKK